MGIQKFCLQTQKFCLQIQKFCLRIQKFCLRIKKLCLRILKFSLRIQKLCLLLSWISWAGPTPKDVRHVSIGQSRSEWQLGNIRKAAAPRPPPEADCRPDGQGVRLCLSIRGGGQQHRPALLCHGLLVGWQGGLRDIQGAQARARDKLIRRSLDGVAYMK